MSGSRLTTLDASFLEVESASAHMHVGWAATLRPAGRAAAPTLRGAARPRAGRMGRAPRYRQRLASVPLGVHDPVWVDDPTSTSTATCTPAPRATSASSWTR